MENFQVNATICVQIINFFIAYLLFRFLLFTPAHRIIVQEQVDRENLNDLIKNTQALIHDKTTYQYVIWQQCHDHYLSNIPQIPQKIELLRGVIPALSYEKPSAVELDKLIAKESDTLVALLGAKYGRS